MIKKRSTILLVDVGNTSTTLGLWNGARVAKTGRVPTTARDPDALLLLVRRWLGRRKIADAVLSTVVPAVRPLWRKVCGALGANNPLDVNHKLKLGVKISYPHPTSIGADRLANAAGVVARYGAPAIVVDFGTATTFDVISAKRGYIGGIIAPGLALMFDYLAERTALLPHLHMMATHGYVGRSTAQAMQLGARWGYRGLTREILAELARGLGEKPVRLIATGGLAGRIVRGARLGLTVDSDLTLYGLGRIYALNRSATRRTRPCQK
jgi:type III pantothenate kinase